MEVFENMRVFMRLLMRLFIHLFMRLLLYKCESNAYGLQL